jgi:hypothetical protein
MLDAGVDLRDDQAAARYADPRTTMRYDRARHNLDRHPNNLNSTAVGLCHLTDQTARPCRPGGRTYDSRAKSLVRYPKHQPVNPMISAARSVTDRSSVLSLVTSAGAEASNPRAASRLRPTA